MIWARPKGIGSIQNDWYSIKIIWTVQNHFGPIEGQGINTHQLNRFEIYRKLGFPQMILFLYCKAELVIDVIIRNLGN